MLTTQVLVGGICRLRQIELSDCTEEYVKWLNDPLINQYLETRWMQQSIGSIEDFVISQRDNDHSYLFAIINNSDDKHIGNIKIGPISKWHGHADISYFIGERDFWGKGIATDAVKTICRFGFYEIGLHRIEAGTYAQAIGSQRVLEKNGFIREGVFRQQALFGDSYVDVYRYGALKSDYMQNESVC